MNLTGTNLLLLLATTAEIGWSQFEGDPRKKSRQIAVYGITTEVRGGVTLRPSLVPDPLVRENLERYLDETVSLGANHPDKHRLSTDEQVALEKLLDPIWVHLSDPSAAIGDGAFGHEIYSVLSDRMLPSNLVARLAAKEIRVHGSGHDLVSVLLERD